MTNEEFKRTLWEAARGGVALCLQQSRGFQGSAVAHIHAQVERTTSIEPGWSWISRIVHMLVSVSSLIERCRSASVVATSARSAHSQTVMTRQSSLIRAAEQAASLARFNVSLSIQKERRLLGTRKNRQSWCACQKQPLINIVARHLVSTRSGLPGRSRRCSRKRNPAANRPERTRRSGRVLLLRMPDIIRDRASGVTTSAIPHSN